MLKRDYFRERVYTEDLTNERNKRILKDKVESGEITLTLNPSKQNPHIYGSKEYNPTNNKSYFTVSIEELQGLLDNNYGTGKVMISNSGQIKETIITSKIIGVVVNPEGKEVSKTSVMTVHYSAKRTHIVPTRSVKE